MNAAVRAAAVAVSLAVIAATSWAEEGAFEVCKNHYILRCQTASFEWTAAAAPLLSHNDGASATLLEDGRVLVVGGASSGGGAEIYDPAIDRWTLAAPMNVMRMHHRAVRLLDGRVLVVGGDYVFLGNVSTTAEIYDPAIDAWSLAPPLDSHRRRGRRDLTANLLPDGRVLVTGGSNAPWVELTEFAETEIYDPATGTWRATGSLASARMGHTATTLADGTVLVFGGLLEGLRGLLDDLEGAFRPTAELYDPVSGAWRTLGPVPPRVNHTATLRADGKVLVAGGESWPPESAGESFLYDPVKGETASHATLALPRFGHVAVAIPGGVLVVGGGRLDQMAEWHGYPTARVERSERYDADSRTWSTIEEIGDPPHEPYSATHLGKGRILFIGPWGAHLLRYEP